MYWKRWNPNCSGKRRDKVALKTTCVQNVKFMIIKIKTGYLYIDIYVGYFYYSQDLNWAAQNLRLGRGSDIGGIEGSTHRDIFQLRLSIPTPTLAERVVSTSEWKRFHPPSTVTLQYGTTTLSWINPIIIQGISIGSLDRFVLPGVKWCSSCQILAVSKIAFTRGFQVSLSRSTLYGPIRLSRSVNDATWASSCG